MKRALLDERQMRRALARARQGAGRVHPNPAVGAVVFRGERVLGTGRTQPPGGPHAEVVAIAAAHRRHGARSLRGADIAVTLEPCCFQGRTGPCTEAIAAAGIRRAVVGCRDPHPRVSGRGLRAMREAGVAVETGVLERECREHHRGFFSVCEQHRPFVTLKLATTLDGRIATAAGESRWITSEQARAWVHRQRAHTDAVMVGSGTALADDPELTARRGDRVVARPVRVLVDSRLRVPPTARLHTPEEGSRTVVLCRGGATGRRALVAEGVEVVDVPGRTGALDLRAGLERLAQLGLTTVFVEGGGGLAAALVQADLADEIHWMLAPRLLGGDAVAALGPLGVTALAEAPRLHWQRAGRLGPDLHLVARPERREGASKRKAGRRR